MMKENNPIRHIFIDLSYFMVQRGYVFQSLEHNGRKTGIYYGVLQLVKQIKQGYPDSVIHICRDGNPIAKRKLYPAYKINRDEVTNKPSKDYSTIKNLQKMLVTYPKVYIWYEPEYEADDLISSLVLAKPEVTTSSVILSGDNDFLQLMHLGVRLCKSIKQGKFILREADYITKKFGVSPEDLLIYRALAGDKSDNIKGVVTPSRAHKLVKENLRGMTEQETSMFAVNLKIMSLAQFTDLKIFHKPLKVTPDRDLFYTFGLENLLWE